MFIFLRTYGIKDENQKRENFLCPVLIAERELIIEREYWSMEKRRKMIHLWQVFPELLDIGIMGLLQAWAVGSVSAVRHPVLSKWVKSCGCQYEGRRF